MLPPPAKQTSSILQKTKIAYSFWFLIYQQLPKTHRYSLGGKIENYFMQLLETIFITLYLPIDKKIDGITKAINKLDGVKFFVQITWENKCIPNKQYIDLSLKLDEIGKILGGWKKGLENKTLTKK